MNPILAYVFFQQNSTSFAWFLHRETILPTFTVQFGMIGLLLLDASRSQDVCGEVTTVLDRVTWPVESMVVYDLDHKPGVSSLPQDWFVSP